MLGWRLLCVVALLATATSAVRRRKQTYNDIDAEGAQNIQITIYPTEAQVREGRDVTFDCRARTADNSIYPPVRWTRVGGPLPSHAHDSSGRLTINPTSLADAGRYVCVATHNGQTVEAHAILNVQSYGPQELQGLMPSSGQCMADEKACGNNECVKSDYVCDGEPDCRDRSDEANCPAMRTCEPNEFKCANQRCVQKMWLCDGDDDCGDNSDEQNCGAQAPGEMCKKTEFQCADQRQCVPSSFHCDGTNDCRDGSDEVGCVQPTVVEPPETNKEVPAGSTFSLSCKAVAVPEAYINWRLNWGPVCEPPRCLQTSEGGFGTLTVHNAQPVDQGAYTCEAINVKGRVLATPDCIVRIVNIPAPTPAPAPLRQPTCDPRGATSVYPDNYGRCDCKPQVTGPNCNECRPGSFHLSEKSPQGCLKCFCFGITDQCRSSSFHRTKDAACERLMFAGDSEGVTLSDIEERQVDRNAPYEYFKTGYLTYAQPIQGTKYWRLPQRFLGDKVTAYGGKMEFEVEYSGSGHHSQEPMVVLKGNQLVLVHRIRNQEQVLQSDSPVRITVETYETSYEQLNGQPATREDLLMVLADLDAFMIRASHVANQHSTSLGDVSWEIAVDRPTGDGLALEVEQCVCPPGYMGTSCEDCAPGYERSGHGPYLGTCVPIQQRAPVCTGAGAVSPQANYGGRCQCKNYAQGPNCDQCAAHSFYMAPTNPQGCIPCFCSGVTQNCQSSSYSRTKVEVDYGRGDRDQLALTTSDSRQPYSPATPGYVSGSAIEFSSFHESNGQTLYWKMPEKFLGNKVTAYGGTLTFRFRFSGEGPTNQDPNVIIRGNDISLQHTYRGAIHPDRENTIEIKLFEDQWQRVDGQQATREHLLMALADLDTLLIKATYIDDCAQSSLHYVSLEYAEPYGRGGRPALEVEQCQCPPGYVGTSCEDCAPGYSRTGGGLYLGLCEKCECNGHATQCDKEYGFCVDCQHNTEGDQCERCKPGFVGDARRGTPHDCQPAATRPPCNCNNHSPRGCDSFGRCLLCEHNTEGTHCDRCKKGYYGDATKGTPYDCTPCPCPGTSDCYLDSQGQVACRNCPAGFSGRLCNECAPGYTRSTKQSGRSCEPIGSVTNQERTYVPSPDAVGRPPQPVIDPPHQTVMEGEPASFRCWVPGIPDCQITFHKEYIGGPLPHGVYQTGNALKIPQTQLHDAGNYICTAINQHGVGKSPNARLDVIRPAQRPRVDPVEQTVDEGEPARFRCWVPGNPEAQLKWHRVGHQPLPQGVQEQQGILHIPRTSQTEVGQYICTATDPRDNKPQDSEPVTLNLRPPTGPPQAPQVEPPEQTVNEGDPAQFRCWVPGNPQAQLKWTRQDGQSLPQGTLERDGYLRLSNARLTDAGQYICTMTEPKTGSQIPAPPATLHVRPPPVTEKPQVDPKEQTVNEGDPAQFRCWVPGNPQAQLKWTRQDGQPLPQGTHERDGYLRLSNAQQSDAGQYICTLTDPRTGNEIPADPATLNVNKPADLKPQVDPPEQTVDEGQPSRIRCWVPGNPRAQLRWTKAGRKPLPQGAHEQQGHLTIPRTMKADEGDYVCNAFDPQTRQQADAPPARINVRGGGPIKPLVDPIEQTVPEGHPFRIRCWVPGRPEIRVHWRKVNAQLPAHVEPHGQGHLTVSQAELSDAGDYICSAEDPHTGTPTDSDPATVHVTPSSAPPVLTQEDRYPEVSPPEQTVPEGDPAVIRCWVQGIENPTLSWKRKDGHPLPFGSSEDGGSLSIPSTQKTDEGDYICTYHPESGSPKDSSPSKLNVESPGTPPRPVATPPVLTVKRGEPARFHCDANSATPAQLSWGHLDADSPLPEGVEREGDDIVIAVASDEVAGEYVCSATNDYGTGVAEPVTLVVTDDEQPPTARVEPRTWNGQPGGRHQFKCIVTGVPTPKVTWTGPNGTPLPHDVTPLEGNILDFANGRSELNGDYTCTATNPIGEASDHGAVNIGPSLVVKTTPAGPRLVLTVGEPLHVKCEAFGDPDPEVEWLHDPGPIRGDLPDDFKPVTISEQFIKHPAIGLGNAGVYTCKGSNSHATATKDIYIEVVEPSRIATVSILGGSAQTFEQGAPSELICTATGSSLVDRLEWVKVDDQLPTDVEEHNEPGLLHFPNFKNSYAGDYECRGYRNDDLIASSTVTVHAAGSEPDEPMVEIEPPRVRVVSQGDSIVLKCSVEGAKNGEHFEWALLRGGNIVRKLGNEATLNIKKADPSNDFGVYRCNVEDDNGVVIGSAYTAVTVGFQDKSNAQVMKFDEKADASFVCPVYSVPGSKVEWSRQDGELPTNAVPNGNKIEIKEFDEASSGLYVCKVIFESNEVEGYVHAQIFVPDTIIQVLLEVSSENVNVGDRAWFDCKVTGDPSAQITWVREGADSLPENSQVTGGRLLFNEVTEENAGVYRCRAKTKAGPLETRSVLNIGAAKLMDPVYLMPYVKNVGEEVFLSCESLMPSDEIFWEKENGSLPADSSTDHGVLRIPYLTKEDEGTYKCVAKQGDLETEFEVRLQVDDFVPVFFGSDSIEFSPLEDDQLKNLEIELTVNPAAPDGVLFFTERRGEVDVAAEESDRRPPVIQHIARLEDGHLIYEYDVGHGRDELVHPVDVPLNEWTTVQVRNDDRAASLQVNNGLPVVKEHPEQIILKGENQPLILGKQPPDEEARRPLPGLKGVVSEVIVSGTSVPIVNGTASPGIRRFDACRAKPCANGGRCRVANRIRGYTCVCQDPFGGYQCETLSSKCKNEHCNGGICINENDTWQCVCPLNSTGLRCEKVVHSPPRKSFAFLNHTSFLAVRSPPLLDQMKISLRLRPNQLTGERVLLYAASEHGESPPAFMSLEVRDRHVVFAQQHGQERQEVKSAEIADTESLGAVDVLLLRDDHGISLVLNGQNSSEKNVVSSFSPVTDLFIGGFPPAFKAPLSVSHNAFQGCIEQMTINSREVDLASWSQYSSGDVVSCESLGEKITAIPSIGVKEEGEIENGTLTEGPTESIEPTKIFPTTTSSTSSTTTTTPSPPVTSEEREIEEEPEEVEETTTTTPAAITTSSTTTTEETEHFYLTEKDKEAPPEVIPTVSAETVEEEECTGVGCVENVTAVTDVCEENDCGPNGRCEAFNSSHYLCVCNLFYDGPRCGVFKPIEHAAHFNGDAFIEISADELPHITSEKEERLHLRFKTTSANGLLLWQGQQPEVPIAGEDYFSLAITNGYLHYSYELGGGAAHLVSPVRVNDGKEHVVRLERRGRTGSMYLDDLPEIRGVSSGILAMLNVDGNIFIGGVPLISHSTGGLHEHNFIGCVADVQMNGQRLDLMGTAIDGKNVRPCEEWLEQKKFIKKRRRT